MELHKNSPKRIYFPGAVYYIVIKTQDNYPYFKETIFCDSFIEDLRICKELKGFGLYGFSVIYDHVNLLIRPGERYNISKIMQSLKRNASRNINIISGNAASFEVPSAPHVGDTSLCRLRGREDCDFPNKKINDLRDRFLVAYGKENPHPKFQWQKSFYDHHIRFHDNIVRQEKDWDYHYNYTVYNHIRHGLPEDWKYTSINYPELIDSIEQ